VVALSDPRKIGDSSAGSAVLRWRLAASGFRLPPFGFHGGTSPFSPVEIAQKRPVARRPFSRIAGDSAPDNGWIRSRS